MMNLLPSNSKSELEDAKMEDNSEKEIEMIGEVKNLGTTKERSMKQKRHEKKSSCSRPSKVLAVPKASGRSSEDKKTVKKKGRKPSLKKFDKSIKKPSDGELLIDLAADEEDILILQEDDFIEIVEIIGKDSVRTRILIDLTEEINTKDHKQDFEDIAEEDIAPKSKRCKRSKSISAGKEALIDLSKHNEEDGPSSASMNKSIAVTNKKTTTVGRKEAHQLEKPGFSLGSPIENHIAAGTIQHAEQGRDRSIIMTVENQSRDLAVGRNKSNFQNKNLSLALPPTDPVEVCKLFVGGLGPETTNQSLKKYFKKWGEVLDAIVKTDPDTNRSKGFGFVTYTRKFMVDNVQKHRPHKVDGRLVCCRRFLLDKTRGFVKDLFIPGLPENIKEKDLAEYFRNFGKILRCSVVTQNFRNGLRKFGFISFHDHDSVDEILILRCHKIKGNFIQPRICLTREQLAERGLKYYLKYFGGFNNWPMSVIEEWIRRHPEFCQKAYPYHQRDIERIHALASSEMYMWSSFWANSSTCSTSSTVSFSVTHRVNEMAQLPSPISQTVSQASCNTSIMDREKIKIEIDSGAETDTKLNFSDGAEHLKAIKEERVTSMDEDLFDAQIFSNIKTE